MKSTFISLLLLCSFGLSARQQIWIRNVEVFNGKDQKTIRGDVWITDNVISKISISPLSSNDSDVIVIDGKGKFLMPGMIDAHWHSFMSANTMMDMLMGETSFLYIRATKESEKTLFRGFTTVRDLAGPVFGMKKAIDMKLVPGPRIYPSGAMVSQTAGHGDFRFLSDPPRMSATAITRPEAEGVSIVADGEYEVLVAVREQLRKGASQIKLAAGGGVASNYDHLDVAQYTEAEMRAAVLAASDWGTYVTVHAYTSEAIQRAIRAGVKCIDHGHLMDEATVKLIADKGIWLSMQPFGEGQGNTYADPAQAADSRKVAEGSDHIYKLAKKYKVKLAWGTDLLFNPANTKTQSDRLVAMKKWFDNYEVLKMVTYDNAQLLALSGPRNPYPKKLGVIEEGAYADLLLVDASPLENLDVLGDPDRNLLLIIKDGKIEKNKL